MFDMERDLLKDLFGKCGANCGHCPAYKENAATAEARQRCCDGWSKYLGFHTTPDRCFCDGCQIPDDKSPILLNPRCNIRKCTTMNGIETCAYCSKYPCEDLTQDLDREGTEARLGAPIPEEDYLAFIEPYENLDHLDGIHASLSPTQLVDPKVPVAKRRIADFPDDLPLSKEEASAFKALHGLLAEIKSMHGSTYARQTSLRKRIQWIFKFLWAVGLFGELKKSDSYITIDGEKLSAQKIPYWMDLEIVDRHLKILKKFGVHCEHVPLTKDKSKWLTTRGHLRKKGWFIKMAIDGKPGNTLKAFKSYVAKLNEKHGRKAFRYFSNVDMQVLSEI